ncbi:hypothetical protein [Nocardioides sp. HB32]
MRRTVQAMLAIAILIDVAYWSIWFTDRDALASEHTQAYYDFENASRSPTSGWASRACSPWWRSCGTTGRRRSG